MDNFSARDSKCPICGKSFRYGCNHSVNEAKTRLFENYIKSIINKQEKEMTDKQIIAKLLTIISNYQKDDIAKDLILEVIPGKADNTIQITKLSTKGEIGKGTPFYSGSMKTIILEEFYEDNVIFDANIRAEEI